MYVKIVAVTFLLVTIPHVLRVIYLMGFHVVTFNHAPGPCKIVPGVEFGSEDMETLPNGLTFITSGFDWSVSAPKAKEFYKKNKVKGKILLFDFNKPEEGVTELRFSEDFDSSTFMPHGLSVIQNEDTGKVTLFVVNHLPSYDSIEKFEFIHDKMLLDHIHSYVGHEVHLEHEKLYFTSGGATRVNDVAAVSENSFYFTNYAYSREHFSVVLEIVLMFPWGNIVYYDGATYRIVQDGLVIPNGIYLSKDKTAVYMSNGAFYSINIFKREANGDLTLSQEYQLHSSPDNILTEPGTGNLVIGTHPSIAQATYHLTDHSIQAPSKVLLVHLQNSTHADHVTELYSNDGHTIQGSSVASIYDKKMLIGTIHHKLLYCELRVFS